MKKCLGVLILIVFTLTLPCLSVESEAAKGGWKKYEDWEGYPTGPFVSDGKWSVSSNCTNGVADISIEDDNGNNRVKFTYNKTTPNSSCYLLINDCPERIVGIKADVTIDSCQGNQDCRGRVAWYRGSTPDDYYSIFEVIQVCPNRYENHDGYISIQASIEDHNNNWQWIEDGYWARCYAPEELIGQTFTVSAIFNKPDEVTMMVNDECTLTHKFNSKMEDPLFLMKEIGMRVGSGTDWNGNPRITNGDFVVYFDDIYIKTKGACDKKKPQAKKIYPKKNVSLTECTVNIIFNEVMDTSFENIDADGDWPIGNTYWSNDQKTFFIERNNCGASLPANTKIGFIVNPDGTGFMDLKGNQAKKKKLTIKTVR